MNMLIRIVRVHFTFHFFGSLLHSREVSSTPFCIVEKTLHLLYPFSGVHLLALGVHSAAREQEASLIAVQYLLNFGLYHHKLGVAMKYTTPN